MRKTLLLLFALPFLLNAQGVTVNAVKGNSLVKQVIDSRKVKQCGKASIEMKRSSIQKMLQNIKSEKFVLTRAGENNELPDSVYEYYDYDGEKILDSKKYLTYYDFGRVKQEIIYVVDEEGVERPAEKNDYTYVVDGNIVSVEIISSYFDDYNNKWVYRYKEKNKVLLEFNDIPLESTIYYYNDETDEWEISDRMESKIEYDSKNRPIVVIMHYDLYDGEEEDYSIRAEITYNDQGLLSNILISESFNGDAFEPMQESEYKYNSKKEIVEEIYRFYDWDIEDWSSDMMTISYEYDEKGNKIKETDTEGDWEWVSYYENIYLGKSSNDNITSAQTVVYPNPVSDVLFIRLENADNAVVTLANAAGGIVLQQSISGPFASIPVQSFAKGYYFLIIKTSKGITTHKVIKF